MGEHEVLRVKLECERDRLTRELAMLETAEAAPERREGRSYAIHHGADDATDTYEHESALALSRHTRGVLGQVERALQRIASGSYGRCEDCDAAIERDRLSALPYATLCLGCQARREGRR